jgi:type IV/VI secretion system ImpK/VasF family protein
LSSVADGTARAALTGCFRPLFLAVAAFHSESTRSRLHPGQFHRTLEELIAGADATALAAGLDQRMYQEAKYAAVALADDLALHTDWDHAREWTRYLLEKRHFNSSFAGQEFFDRLGRLRQTLAGVQDPVLREQVLGTLEVYATCLRLGFRGRYRGASQNELEAIGSGALALLQPPGDKGARHRAWSEAYGEAPKGRILSRSLLWWWPIPVVLLAAVALWYFTAIRLSREIDSFQSKVDEKTHAGEAPAKDAAGTERK